MKKNNKTWIQQLSEAYIRQALNESDPQSPHDSVVRAAIGHPRFGNESDFHQEIDNQHARLVPEDAGKIKQILDAHAAEHGPFVNKEAAVNHIVDNYPHLNPRTGEGRQLSSIGWAEHLYGTGRSTFPSNDSRNDTYSG